MVDVKVIRIFLIYTFTIQIHIKNLHHAQNKGFYAFGEYSIVDESNGPTLHGVKLEGLILRCSHQCAYVVFHIMQNIVAICILG